MVAPLVAHCTFLQQTPRKHKAGLLQGADRSSYCAEGQKSKAGAPAEGLPLCQPTVGWPAESRQDSKALTSQGTPAANNLDPAMWESPSSDTSPGSALGSGFNTYIVGNTVKALHFPTKGRRMGTKLTPGSRELRLWGKEGGEQDSMV